MKTDLRPYQIKAIRRIIRIKKIERIFAKDLTNVDMESRVDSIIKTILIRNPFISEWVSLPYLCINKY
jgi:hypothetical protein